MTRTPLALAVTFFFATSGIAVALPTPDIRATLESDKGVQASAGTPQLYAVYTNPYNKGGLNRYPGDNAMDRYPVQ